MRKPDFEGLFGKAWKIDAEAAASKVGVQKDQNCLIRAWVVHAPHSHPIWPWYRITVVTLADKPGVPPPKIYLEGATHEMVIEALNPGDYPPPVDDLPKHVMTPSNFCAQIVEVSDDAAYKRVENGAVKAIVHGFLNPDTDYMSEWAKAFGDNMTKRGWK